MKALGVAAASVVLAITPIAHASNKVLRLGSAQSAGNAGASSAWSAPNQTGALTVEFWLRLEPATQSQTQFGRPFSLRGCSCGGITLNAFAEGARGRLEIELGTIDAWSATTFSLSAWHHFAITWSRAGREVRLHVDGILVFQRTIAAGSSIQICDAPELRMGEQCGRGMVGAIDNMRYWSIERTTAQIVADMSRQYTQAEAQAAPGLIGAWSFEGGVVSNAVGTTPAGALQSDAAIVEEPLLPDCNNDGIVDFGQILSGEFQDANRNGIPDRVCECLGDLNADGAITGADLGQLLAAWGAAPLGAPADLNADGSIDGFDLAYMLAGWGPCAQ